MTSRFSQLAVVGNVTNVGGVVNTLQDVEHLDLATMSSHGHEHGPSLLLACVLVAAALPFFACIVQDFRTDFTFISRMNKLGTLVFSCPQTVQ